MPRQARHDNCPQADAVVLAFQQFRLFAEEDRKLLADKRQGTIQDIVGEVHARLAQLAQESARRRDDAALFGDQHQSECAAHWDAECRCATSRGEIVHNRFATGMS
jgi:hypothetical protein